LKHLLVVVLVVWSSLGWADDASIVRITQIDGSVEIRRSGAHDWKPAKEGDVLDRGLLAFIHSLRPTMKTGMISNAWDDLRAYLAREKITDAFDTIVISAEVGRAKPDPEIYRLALEQAQVEPHEALFVDDVQANIEGCERVGMRGILFRDPDMVIQEIKALI